jgi:hypothetical protein
MTNRALVEVQIPKNLLELPLTSNTGNEAGTLAGFSYQLPVNS